MSSTQEATDLEALRPTPMAKIGGGALLAVSAFVVLTGVQAWSLVVRFNAALVAFVALLLLLGVAGAICGFKVTRLRGWAGVTGTVTGGLATLVLLAWFVYAAAHGVASLLALALVPADAVATILVALTIGAGRRADAARARLREAGLEAGT